MTRNIYYLLILIGLIGCGKETHDCEVRDLEVTVGECNCLDAYELRLDFIHDGAPSEYFTVYTRNDKVIGSYKLESLPLTLPKFELSGKDEEYVKVCLDEKGSCCCTEIEFEAPDCGQEEKECRISELEVKPRECNEEGGYELYLNFEYEGADNEFFDVYIRNNELIGYYKLSDLPIILPDFKPSGGKDDFLKVCINDTENCCAEAEWEGPDCEEEACNIFDLVVETGECHSEEYYQLYLDFEYDNPSHTNFEVFVRDKVRIGNYPLSALPLKIEEFKKSGKDYDYIKVCMSDDEDCCEVIEFMPPECEEEGEDECIISAIEFEIGDCNDDGTFPLTIYMDYENPTDESFDVYVRNSEHIGFFKLSDLPVTIEDFVPSGNDEDYIKICINDNNDCCKEAEFLSPDC